MKTPSPTLFHPFKPQRTWSSDGNLCSRGDQFQHIVNKRIKLLYTESMCYNTTGECNHRDHCSGQVVPSNPETPS